MERRRPAGTAARAVRRLKLARGALGALLVGWLVAALAGGLPPALALDRLTERLPGGSAEVAAPGGAVAVEAALQGRGPLTFALSTALGVALAFGLLVEPFLRGALLCSLGRCGGGCRWRGVAGRGVRHFLPLVTLQVGVWTLLLGLGAVLVLAGFPVALLPGVWLALSVLQDVTAVALVASSTLREAAGLLGETLRRRPLEALGAGILLRLAALVPLGALGVALASGPSATATAPVVLVGLPAVTLVVRAGWWALLTEVVHGVRDERGASAARLTTGATVR